MWQWTAKYEAINSGKHNILLEWGSMCFNINQFPNVMFFINKWNKIIIEKKQNQLPTKTEFASKCRFGRATISPWQARDPLPHPWTLSLKRSHPAWGGQAMLAGCKLRWHVKVTSPRHSAHIRCFESTPGVFLQVWSAHSLSHFML